MSKQPLVGLSRRQQETRPSAVTHSILLVVRLNNMQDMSLCCAKCAPDGLGDVGAVGRRAGICRCCSKAHLVVDDHVYCAASRKSCIGQQQHAVLTETSIKSILVNSNIGHMCTSLTATLLGVLWSRARMHIICCFILMLCCLMLCYVMLCYVMLCYVMLCYVMLCYVMLCYVMLCYVCYVILYYILSYCKCLLVDKEYCCEVWSVYAPLVF